MSKERLDCEDLCPNYYSSWEEGTCMECCEIHHRGECTVVYINDLEKQIADLEAKLAEKDKTIENWQTMYQNVMKSCHNGIEEDKRLREQLAEKEQNIEEINKEFVQAVKDWKSLVEKKNKDIVELEEHDDLYHNQLAIEQLEKVKELIKNMSIGIGIEIYGTRIKPVEEYIDNQIEELKKELNK